MPTERAGVALDGHRYLLASEAAADFGYNSDYIARLARHGKINGRRVGKKWYVEPDSLRAYLKVLGETPGPATISSEVPERTSAELIAHAMHTRGRHTMRDWSPPVQGYERPRSVSSVFPLASLALAVILSTAAAYAAFNPTGASTNASRVQSQFAAASADTSIFDRAAQFLFRTVCPIFRSCDPNDVRIADAGGADQNIPSTPLPRQAATTAPTSSPQTASTSFASASSTPTAAGNPPVVQRVVERIVERALPTYTIATPPAGGGITEAILNDRLDQLDNKLSSRIFSLSASLTSVPNSLPASGGVTNNVALSQRIDNLDGTTISNPTITGGNVTATSFSGLLGVGNGGTGTSSAPSYGELLVGNTAGGYDLLATSSLGISAGGIPGGSDTYVQFNNGDVFGGVSSFTFASTTGLLTVPYASTTALTISGTASTSQFYANGLTNCDNTNVLTWTNGTFGCKQDNTSTGQANPFDWEINFGAVNMATTSILWAQSGVNASSTSHFDFASSTAFTNSGPTWLTALSGSALGLGVDANGKVYAAATSTLSTISGALALSSIAQIGANSVLVNNTSALGNVTEIATSSFFGTGIGGQVLAWNGGVPQWVATTTLTNGTGITTTYNAASNQWTFTNTGATFAFPFTTSTTYATTTVATTTSIWTTGVFFASSTAAASQFPFASSTALSAGTLCLSTDCRTSWPTGGTASDPFPIHTSYAGQTTSATSSTLWLTGSTISLAASSSVLTFASSTAITSSAIWVTPLGTPAGTFIAVDPNGQIIATATPAVGGGGTVTNVSGANGIAGSVSSNGSLSLVSYLATSSGEVAGNLSYWTTTNGNPAKLGTVATTSLTASGVLSLSNPISVIGAAASEVTLVGGSNGQVLGWAGGVPAWVATTTLANGSGISTTYSAASNQWTITNTGATFAFPFTTSTTYATTTVATTTSIWTTGVFFASSTAAASQFPFASSTALSAGTLCLSTDCRTSWPTAASTGDPFTHETWWGQSGVSATTSALHLTGSPFSLFASSTAVFDLASSTAASTTRLTTGTQWFPSLSNSGLGVDANGKVYAAATSTLANISGTLALTQLANQNANTVLANATAGSAAPTAIATSSFFGTGIGGQVLAWNGGVPQWVATTTLTNGTGITTTYNAASNQWTITNTGATFAFPFTTSTTYATTTVATTTSIWTTGVFFASSTAAASQFTFASSTALSAGTLCIAADCRTSWPTGGSASDPFPVHTSYAGLTTSGTSSTLWLTGATVSLAASSSVLTFASSTAFTASGSGYFAADAGASVGVGTTSPWALLSINPNGIAGPAFAIGSSTATNFLVTNAGKVGIGTTSPTYALDVNGDVNVASGKCFRVNGVCIGYTVMLAAIYATSSPGTNVSVIFGNGGPRFSGGTLTLPATTTRFVVEVWGAGGGGGGGGGGGSGGTGGTSSFGTGLATTSATGGGGGVAGGSSAACNGGGGGSGGVGSGGNIINLTGQGGAGGEGVATASYSGKGGSGGSAPRGGGGGQSSFGAGNAGAAFGGGSSGGGGSSNCGGGGGGGGGYASSLYSAPSGTYLYNIGTGGTYGTAGTNTGGNGGVGGIVITVYATSSPNAAGYDYAEMFPVSNPGITAGDIVAVDAGVPVSMKLAAAGEAAPLAGIIATNPGQVLGDINATGERPVALSGRVPAKVNLEAGPISIGDRIAPSSVPGVGKKAGSVRRLRWHCA